MEVNAERLAYWYLRLNGFLTIPGFVVHPDRGSNQETDVDLIGARLPYRAENPRRQMVDDHRLILSGEKILVIFAEVKAGRIGLNGPWTNQKRGNMLRVLHAVGPLPTSEAKIAAKALHESGVYTNELYHISLVCMGRDENEDLRATHPKVSQITWSEVLQFIYNRFRGYRREKRSHGQWETDGQNLWREAERARDMEEFVAAVRIKG